MLQTLDENAPLVIAAILAFVALCLLLASISVLLRVRRRRPISSPIQSSTRKGLAQSSSFDVFRDVPFSSFIAIDPAKRAITCIAGSFEHMTGLPGERVLADAYALGQCLGQDQRRSLLIAFDEWDRSSLLELEVELEHLETHERLHCALSVYPDPTSGLWIMELRDITDVHREMLSLEQRASQAEENEAAKLRFLSDMSHEIRTPMNGIMGTLALAKVHHDNPEQVSEYLEQADDLTAYLLSIINNVLDISKIENGKMELEDRCFSLEDVLEQMRSLFGESTKMKGINYTVTGEDIVSPYVIGDELRLVQVITNLVSNAQKFTPAGGTIKVELFATQTSEERLHFMIRVSDTGKGMDKKFLETIFDPFSQESSSTSRQFGGTGLGMAISDQIIRLMGGYIIVESELGKGSTFEIYLALPFANADEIAGYQAERGAGATDVAADDTQAALFTLEDSVILLAEDNMLNATIAQEMLLETGAARVDHATDGAIACEMFASAPPHTYSIILMDIQMPNMDGRTAAKAIRAMDRQDAAEIPIIALSADAYVEDKRASRKAGMNGHISKPIVFETLERQICEELAQHSSTEED